MYRNGLSAGQILMLPTVDQLGIPHFSINLSTVVRHFGVVGLQTVF